MRFINWIPYHSRKVFHSFYLIRSVFSGCPLMIPGFLFYQMDISSGGIPKLMSLVSLLPPPLRLVCDRKRYFDMMKVICVCDCDSSFPFPTHASHSFSISGAVPKLSCPNNAAVYEVHLWRKLATDEIPSSSSSSSLRYDSPPTLSTAHYFGIGTFSPLTSPYPFHSSRSYSSFCSVLVDSGIRSPLFFA